MGETGDFFVNEQNTYNITGVEFVPADASMKSGIIPRSSIITFGKDLLVVQDDVIDQLIESPHSIEEESEEKKNTSLEQQSPSPDVEFIYPEVVSQEPEQAIPAESETEKEESYDTDSLDTDISYQIPFESTEEEKTNEGELGLEIPSEAPAAEETQNEQPLSAAELFEQRQRQYLVGKKVTKTIYTSDGRVIINNGDIITEQLINEVKANGKLIELVMNYEE